MKTQDFKTYQVDSDGTTVWVNDENGCSIGRFGRFGIDIHNSMVDQVDGKPQCLMCTHGKTTAEDWNAFVKGMKNLHGVDVHDRHRPDRHKIQAVPVS